jgi:hypothetical protein
VGDKVRFAVADEKAVKMQVTDIQPPGSEFVEPADQAQLRTYWRMVSGAGAAEVWPPRCGVWLMCAKGESQLS